MKKFWKLVLKFWKLVFEAILLVFQAILQGFRDSFVGAIAMIVFLFIMTGVAYLITILVRSVSTVVQLITLEYQNLFPVWKTEFFRFRRETSACFQKSLFFFEDLTQFYLNLVVFPLGNFLNIVLHSKSWYLFWYFWLAVMALIGAIAAIFLLRRIFFVLQKMKNNPKTEDGGNMAEEFLLIVAAIGTVLPLAFVSKKVFSYLLNFFKKVLRQMMQNRIGAGLLCGFLGTAKGAYFPYLLVVPRLFFDNYEDSFWFEHHQKRVAAISSFVVGQLYRFLFFYDNRLFESLFKVNYIVVIFFTFLVLQAVWTHETIVKNWKYLHQNDKRKKVLKRILFLQLEFVANFFLQLLPSEFDLEIQKPNSMVYILFQRYLEDKIFVRVSFLGCVLGHIVFIPVWLKLFELGMVWVYPHLKKIFEGGSNGDQKRGGWDLFRYD